MVYSTFWAGSTVAALPSTELLSVMRVGIPNKIPMEVPNINSSFKAYMSYKTITNKSSNQWKLQQTAYTDGLGLRKVGEYYCVALGSYYGTEIGTKYIIKLDTGVQFGAILSDCKMDIHTDSTNRYVPQNGNVVEFLVDTNKLDPGVKRLGTVSFYDKFKGNIVSIEKIMED